MRAALSVLAIPLLIGATNPRGQNDQARLAKALAGRTPGKPMSCIPLAFPTLTTQTIGRTLLYKRGNGDVYVNETSGGCEGAAHNDILVQVEHEGRPCSGDIIRTIDNATRMPTGSCSLGQFVPYTKTPR